MQERVIPAFAGMKRVSARPAKLMSPTRGFYSVRSMPICSHNPQMLPCGSMIAA